jgi:TatD DNase family protein
LYVDSHCHLTFPAFRGRIDELRAAMAQAQVVRALVICTRMEEFADVHALALGYPEFWASVGVHPDSDEDEDEGQGAAEEPSVADLVERAALPRVVAIGETGLDYYRLNGRSVGDMEWQRERFRVHIRAARQAGKPLVIHTRSASDDTLAILREEGAEAAGGVFHCFTETMAVARAALDLGMYVSFSGILTFRNAEDLREVARYVPLERTLIETDSPYLAPVPFRGKTNQPAYVPHVARQLAAIKGVSEEEVAAATAHNFARLFRLDSAVSG